MSEALATPINDGFYSDCPGAGSLKPGGFSPSPPYPGTGKRNPPGGPPGAPVYVLLVG